MAKQDEKALAGKILALEAELQGAKEIINDLQQMAFQPRHVIVCTEKRGVIFGWLTACAPLLGTSYWRVKLTDVRQCVYWAQSVRGLFGLAATGPNGECRVGPPAPALEDVAHAILDVTPAAVAAWGSAPWATK